MGRLLPRDLNPPPRGRPRVSNRQPFAETVFVIKTGAPRQSIPGEMNCGSECTPCRRFGKWNEAFRPAAAAPNDPVGPRLGGQRSPVPRGDRQSGCRAVRNFLTRHSGRIILHYLPKYAPETNPIWRIRWHLHEPITRHHRCLTIDALLNQVYDWGPHGKQLLSTNSQLQNHLPARRIALR